MTTVLTFVAFIAAADEIKGFDLAQYENKSQYDENTIFTIYSYDGLINLAKIVNEGVSLTFEGKKVCLMNDIDMPDSHDWIPIGSGGFFPFKGLFDGQNHAIRNLTITSDNSIGMRGLFGEIEGGTVQNLTLENVNIEGHRELEDGGLGFETGTIAGKAFSSSIINCHVTGRVQGSDSFRCASSTGSLIGAMDGGELSDCSNSAEVIGADNDSASDTGGLVGSMVAFETDIYVRNCFNEGTVTRGKSDFWSNTGGLIGQYTGQEYDLLLTDCYNTGSVRENSSSSRNEDENTGGLIGGAMTQGTHIVIRNSFSYAEIESGSSWTGGLIGLLMNQNIEEDEEEQIPARDGSCTLENSLAVLSSSEGINGLVVGGRTADCVLSNNYAYAADGGTYGEADGKNGARWNGRTDAPPFVNSDSANDWDTGLWNFDSSHQTMPVLQGDFPAPPAEIHNPAWSAPSFSYSITLEVAPGIDLSGIKPGELTVEEGDGLLLTFRPENRELGAADVLLLVDGNETSFKDLGGNLYFTYRLEGIEADHSIVVALREYTVTLPEVKGCAIYPSAGIHKVAYGEPFRFGMLLPPYKNPADITLYADGVEMTPEQAESFHDSDNPLRNDESSDPLPETEPIVLIYTLEKVTGPFVITVEDRNPTDNLHIGVADLKITIDNGQLTIDLGRSSIDNYSGKAVDVAVYNLRGQVVAQRKVSGTDTIALSTGIYIVRVGGETYKVIVP